MEEQQKTTGQMPRQGSDEKNRNTLTPLHPPQLGATPQHFTPLVSKPIHSGSDISHAFRSLKTLFLPHTGPKLRVEWATGRVSPIWKGMDSISFDQADRPSFTRTYENVQSFSIRLGATAKAFAALAAGSQRIIPWL